MSLQVKRLELELSRVRQAKIELEFRILERQEEIATVEQSIVAQNKREAELLLLIKEGK